ncbi:hypothetical protein Glove_89g136 [Diversispora epigaea]|uniref:Uncharacterized protein n=1 Tax=Diversispora epigaea TaxID=1348612 RepID=A0A397JG48_9GLOM|nr:hypothetical protein Glove_89g136 [Diversispora epigaea]
METNQINTSNTPTQTSRCLSSSPFSFIYNTPITSNNTLTKPNGTFIILNNS